MRTIRAAVIATVLCGVFAGGAGLAQASTATQAAAKTAVAQTELAARIAAARKAAVPEPPTDPDLSEDPDRNLVADIAEMHEDVEVREAARAALANPDPNAVINFLDREIEGVKAKAAKRKKAEDDRNRSEIQKLAGTGGRWLREGVDRALAGTPYDRANFLAWGKDIAIGWDTKDTEDAKELAKRRRDQVALLAAGGGLEVAKAAQAALDAGSDTAVEEFFKTGYQAAAQRDSDAHEAKLREQEERNKELARLTEEAKRAAKAAEARRNLVVAHGETVKGLEEAANAMIMASNAAREAEKILQTGKHGTLAPDAYNSVRNEVVRQTEWARKNSEYAKAGSIRANLEATRLVEAGHPHGTQWAQVATALTNSADAAHRAALTAQHAVTAIVATQEAKDAQAKAEAHAEQAKKWREYAEQSANSAAALAVAAKDQAKVATDAAERTKKSRTDAERAEQKASAAAKRTRDARLVAEREQRNAAAAKTRAEQERRSARDARVRADQQASAAAGADTNAKNLSAKAKEADAAAWDHEGKAAAARREFEAAERAKNAALTKAKAMETMAAAAKSGAKAGEAQAALDLAKSEAGRAENHAGASRAAANQATDAATRSRAAATRANGAAARATAAAATAQQEAAVTHHQALVADAAAATATAEQVKAADAADTAVNLAQQAADEALAALQAAHYTQEEATAAATEAATAAVQAGLAVRAAQAARISAAGIADPANTAINTASPFAGSDIDADFAILVANHAKTVGAEHVQTAQRAATEAENAAAKAKEAADRAGPEVALAFQAAARAAKSAADAAHSAAEAQDAAARAAVDGGAARAAAARADQADAQARADAKAARGAAAAARNDAAIAGRSAAAAEQEAAAARGAASRAEESAKSARNAANEAETAAKSAEAAATNAKEHAKAAEEAVRRVEEAERQEKEARQKAAFDSGAAGAELTPAEKLALQAVGASVEDYEKARALLTKDMLQFLKENGLEILIKALGADNIVGCFKDPNIESCLWAAFDVVLSLTPLKWVELGFDVGKGLLKLGSIVWKFVEESMAAKKSIELGQKAIQIYHKLLPCVKRSGVPKSAPALAADGPRQMPKEVRAQNAKCGPDFSMDDAQFGSKWGKHSKDYNLNPGDPGARKWFKDRVHEVRNSHDEARTGAYNPGQGGSDDYWFYRKGDDLLITKGDGSFVTMFPLGTSGNNWWNKAYKIACGC